MSDAPPFPPPPHDLHSTGLPLRFRALGVVSHSGTEELVPTVGSSLLDVAVLGPMRRRFGPAAKPNPDRIGRERLLIAGVEGLVHQGELLLIVGPPTSNASVLLRALSAPNDLELAPSSQLDYGLLPPSAVSRPALFAKSDDGRLRSEVVYLGEHDVHFATLTLVESLMPGSLAKTPRSRDPGVSRVEYARTHLEALVGALGLSHAMGTKIGSPLVRGLSGGERKRASIVESLLTRASVLLLDGATNGLDSSTALSLLSVLRTWTKTGKRSLIATTPHIADPLYHQFDKVLVLSSTGRQVYFGRTGDAQAYFEGLGLGYARREAEGEGVAEFLVGCIEGRGRDIELERDWRASSARKGLLVDMDAYDARYAGCARPLLASLEKEKSIFTSRTSPYMVSFVAQVAILTRRQYALIISELPTYVTKTFVNLCISVLVGTLFFQLPATSTGAFTRGSLLLLSILFNGYLSLAELGKTIEGRDIVKRQGDFGFFGASALALARVAGDLPLIGLQVLLFGTVTYFLAGLQRDIEKFLIYLLFVYATALNLSAMFRMFASFSPSFDEAIRYCGVALNIIVIFAGYFIPTRSMPSWLRWIHYVLDPISYSFEAVLTNEFHNLNLTCAPSQIVPSGPSYTDLRYQTCTLPGSTPGSLLISGDAYLATAFEFSYSHLWRNLAIIGVQALVFLVIAIVSTDYLHFTTEGTKRVWARTRRVEKRLRRASYKTGEETMEDGTVGLMDEENLSAEDSAIGEEEGDELATKIEGSVLVWKDVSLWVDTDLDTRRLLDHISGYIQPGMTCALMGASGAGKSTLLNVLAGRGEGVVKGTVLVDGRAPDADFYRTTGYVEQFDLHDDRSTVREALEFSALLRQDSTIPRAEKLAYVDVVLGLLDLTHLQDAIIGTPSAGLNPEQRKRLTIATEVVARPAVLFCDEPTTGLDTKSALRVVKLLRRLSRTGLAVIATIHQPSAETFAIFDSLLLLQRGGKQVYYGPRQDAVEYFSSTGSPSPSAATNPADYLLEVASAGVDISDDELLQLDTLDALPARWTASPRSTVVAATIAQLSATLANSPVVPSSSASTMLQCVELTKRVSRHFYRDPSFSYTKIFTATVVACIVGLSFFQLGNDVVSLQNRMFSVFLILFVPPVFMNLIIFKMFKLRNLFTAREEPSRIYGKTAFVTSLLLSELPYTFVCGTIYFVLWYFLVGLPLVPRTIWFAYVMVQLFFFFQSTWALWITALAPSLGTVANLLPFFLVSMEAFNGSLMPYSSMPFYWKWLYWMSPFQWYVRAMLSVILHDQPIHCAPSELVTFNPPPGLTCGTYMTEYLSTSVGYLVDPTLSSLCEFCKFSTGDDFLHTLNITYDDRFLGLGVFALYSLTNVGLIYLFTFHPPRIPTSWRKVSSRAKMLAEDEERREAIEREGMEEVEAIPRGL